MAYAYQSAYSTLSAQSTEPVHIGENSRPRSLSSKDKFYVSQNRTRVPSNNMPRHESKEIQTAENLLAAETGPSISHRAGRHTNDSMSRNVGPATSASRDAVGPTTLRTQRNEIAVGRPNADGRGMISNVGRRVADRGKENPSEPSGSGSSISDGLSRAISIDSVTTSNRDFSGSSSGSQGEVATKALNQYNTFASQCGLSLLEDEEIDQLASASESETDRPPQSRRSRFLRKSGSRAQLVLSSITKAITRASSKSNLRKETLKGKTIEELGKGGVSIMYLREGFSVGELLVPTFLCNLMKFIEASEDKKNIFRLSGDKTVETELMRCFAAQLPRADDESKFDQGAASTSLPQHIPYGVMDVACVLKTITCGLPCGVFGSLSLFYAIASIHNKFEHNIPNSSQVHVKLFALAIASVKSTLRKSFIIAFLGLASTIGHETFFARNKENLMSFSALGPLLGPSLIGERTQDINLNIPNTGLTEAAQSIGNKYKFVSAVTVTLIGLWPVIMEHLEAIEKGEFPIFHRNPRLLSEQSRSSARLSRVLEDAELEDHSLQHEHRVDRRVFNTSQATSSSQGATSSSSGGSVRHHSEPSFGHRQPLPRPYHSHPQEQSERGFTGHQYFSAQRNEPSVQAGNNRGPASGSSRGCLRDQLDGQFEEDCEHNQSFAAPTNESQLQVNDDRPAVSAVRTQSPNGILLTVTSQVLSETGTIDSRPDPAGRRPSSTASIHSQEVVQGDHQAREASGCSVDEGPSRPGEEIFEGVTSTVPPSQRTRSRRDPDPSVSQISDEGREGMAYIPPDWYAPFITNNEVPWARDSTQEREGSSVEAGETSHVQGTSEGVGSAVSDASGEGEGEGEDHHLVTEHSLLHANNFTFATTEHIKLTTSTASSSLATARDTSGISSTAAAMPTSQPPATTATAWSRRAEIVEARAGARLWADRAAALRAELESATREADAWEARATALEEAEDGPDQDDGPQVQATNAHEERLEGDEGDEGDEE